MLWGACYSPSFAGLFLGKWEKDYVLNSRTNPYMDNIIWWERYIDVIIYIYIYLFIFFGSKEDLISLHQYLNNTNSNMKLYRI